MSNTLKHVSGYTVYYLRDEKTIVSYKPIQILIIGSLHEAIGKGRRYIA